MAICDWLKYVTILLTFLVCSCISEELDNVNNVNNEGQILHLLNKRSTDQHGQFWKRDTEKSSFWKRDVDEALPALLEARAEEEKRRAQFLGKRGRSQFLGKREDGYSDDEGYALDALEDEAEKRSRMNFLGKRGNRQAFLGKRPRQAFLGKRSRLSFLGKRENGVDGMSDAEVEEYLEQLEPDMMDYDKRGRSQFLGKRGSRVAFLGKRDHSDFLNYRIAYDLHKRSRSYPRKRPRLAFLGKRSYDDLDNDKRARVAFLGKRSAEVVGAANSE